MIYSIKHTGDITSKIIFHISISANISFYYFELKKKKKNLGAFDRYCSIIIIIIIIIILR